VVRLPRLGGAHKPEVHRIVFEEGPACLAAVVEEADRLAVTVHRVSRGSGVFLITDQELDHMREIAQAGNVEVSLFARPNAAWDESSAGSGSGPLLAALDRRGPSSCAPMPARSSPSTS
jgi:hypothetical protein